MATMNPIRLWHEHAARPVLVAIALATTTPAFASDFTGMLTVLAALYGGVFVMILLPVFGVTLFVKNRAIRRAMLILSFFYASFLTYAWARVDPLINSEEIFALLLVSLPTLVCLMIAVATNVLGKRE